MCACSRAEEGVRVIRSAPMAEARPDPTEPLSFVADAARPKVAVLGVGQMGMVCSAILVDAEVALTAGAAGMGQIGSRNGVSGTRPRPVVRLWGHSPDETGHLAQARRSDRLPGMVLPGEVKVTMKAKEALADADVIVSAIPVQYSRGVWETIRPFVPPKAAVLSVAKGIENGTLLRPTQIIAEVLGDDPDRAARPLGVLSGPTIAGELARCLPATMVAARLPARVPRPPSPPMASAGRDSTTRVGTQEPGGRRKSAGVPMFVSACTAASAAAKADISRSQPDRHRG